MSDKLYSVLGRVSEILNEKKNVMLLEVISESGKKFHLKIEESLPIKSLDKIRVICKNPRHKQVQG